MSYAVAGFGGVSAVRVGAAAKGDPLLASASLIASEILLQATRKPPAVRGKFVENRLNALSPGMARQVFASRARISAGGKAPDQALFDAMRLAIANVKMEEGIQSLRASAAREYGAEAFGSLGDLAPSDRATGCAIASTTGTVGGIASIIPVYGTIVGGILGIGAQVAGGAMDCSRETREANAAAAQAQANVMMAQQQAVSQTQSTGSNMRLYLIGGGALVAALGIGYLVLS